MHRRRCDRHDSTPLLFLHPRDHELGHRRHRDEVHFECCVVRVDVGRCEVSGWWAASIRDEDVDAAAEGRGCLLDEHSGALSGGEIANDWNRVGDLRSCLVDTLLRPAVNHHVATRLTEGDRCSEPKP